MRLKKLFLGKTAFAWVTDDVREAFLGLMKPFFAHYDSPDTTEDAYEAAIARIQATAGVE